MKNKASTFEDNDIFEFLGTTDQFKSKINESDIICCPFKWVRDWKNIMKYK